jgi:hypothetical protein
MNVFFLLNLVGVNVKYVSFFWSLLHNKAALISEYTKLNLKKLVESSRSKQLVLSEIQFST